MAKGFESIELWFESRPATRVNTSIRIPHEYRRKSKVFFFMETGASSGTIPGQILGDAAPLAHENTPAGQGRVPGRRTIRRVVVSCSGPTSLRKRRAEGREQRRDALAEYAEQFPKDAKTIVSGIGGCGESGASSGATRPRSCRSGGSAAIYAML